MSSWLESVKNEKLSGPKKKSKKKSTFSFNDGIDDAPPISNKQAQYEDLIERLTALAEDAEANDNTDHSIDELIRETVKEEGDDDAHDLFGEGFAVDLKRKAGSRCGQYKTSKFACEDAGCNYSEGTTKAGKRTSYCREKTKKKPSGCGQHKKNKRACEDAGCDYSEGYTKTGRPASYCRQRTKKKSSKKKTASPAGLPHAPYLVPVSGAPPGMAMAMAQPMMHGMPMVMAQPLRPGTAPAVPMAMAQPLMPGAASKMAPSPMPIASFLMPIQSAPPGMASAHAVPMPGAYTMRMSRE